MNTPAKPLRKRGSLFVKHFKQNWQLYLIILIPAIYALIFYYGPMYGVQIAFRDYRPKTGITGSEWVGLRWFKKFLSAYQFKQVFSNTVILSLYGILVSFPLPIIFALFLNSIENKRFVRLAQNITYIPHFFSVVVLVAIMNMLFSPMSGLYGQIYKALGGVGIPADFRKSASTFRHLYVWSGVWQNLAWDSIIYTAALSSVSKDLHEAAMIDGASKWERIWHVDLPAILPTVAIMLILRCGSIMSIGFDKAYLMQSATNLQTSEVISTYVYKQGMDNVRNFSYGAAVGLFNSVINCAMLLLVNWTSSKVSDKEVSMF